MNEAQWAVFAHSPMRSFMHEHHTIFCWFVWVTLHISSCSCAKPFSNSIDHLNEHVFIYLHDLQTRNHTQTDAHTDRADPKQLSLSLLQARLPCNHQSNRWFAYLVFHLLLCSDRSSWFNHDPSFRWYDIDSCSFYEHHCRWMCHVFSLVCPCAASSV